MEVKIIRKSDTEIEMEVRGESHTLMNALKAALLEDQAVETATYTIEFPGVSEPVLFVKTSKGEDPIDAIKKAAGRLAGQCEDFTKLFAKKAKA
ncbi:MAG TPA: DNA-directed RNA polymerase subunit L [Methanocella sp.]|nr:DNA-directed RNA polymerase subunit L [Methanocella sp.]